MGKLISLRLDEDLLEWADAYAASRQVTRTVIVALALKNFREDCETGVPDLKTVRKAPANEWEKTMRARQAKLNKERA